MSAALARRPRRPPEPRGADAPSRPPRAPPARRTSRTARRPARRAARADERRRSRVVRRVLAAAAARSRPASTASSCTAPTATCCTSSCPPVANLRDDGTAAAENRDRSWSRSPRPWPAEIGAGRVGIRLSPGSWRRRRSRPPSPRPRTYRVLVTGFAPFGLAYERAVRRRRRPVQRAPRQLRAGQVIVEHRLRLGDEPRGGHHVRRRSTADAVVVGRA